MLYYRNSQFTVEISNKKLNFMYDQLIKGQWIHIQSNLDPTQEPSKKLSHILAVRLKQAMTGGLIRSLTQYWQVKTVTMYKEPQLKYSTCSCT